MTTSKGKRAALVFSTVVAGILVAASVAYACTVAPPQTEGNMVIVPPTNAVAGAGIDIIVAGECLGTINGCMNVTDTQSQTGTLKYAFCGVGNFPADLINEHACSGVGVTPGGLPVPDNTVHTFHQDKCNGSSTDLDDNSGTNDNQVTITRAVPMVNNVNKVNGEARMAAGLAQGVYVVCANITSLGNGGGSYNYLWNFFTYL